MSAAQSAQHAYTRKQAPTRTPRTIEYDLLAQATQRLTTAWPGRRHDFAALAKALDENLRLWSTLAADVADPGNGLPAALRARLFYIYQFTEKHSRDVLNKDANVEVLAEINTAVMRGLRGEASAT